MAGNDSLAEGLPARRVIVMGVTGSGKSTLAAPLAKKLGWTFIEGDSLHPPENVERMRSGQPLTDADRLGWLDAIGDAMIAALATSPGVIVTCSALKRSYRDRLRRKAGDIFLIFLAIDRNTAAARVSRRRGHFMPASLVDSQFADLETPSADEWSVTLDATHPVDALVADVVKRVDLHATTLSSDEFGR